MLNVMTMKSRLLFVNEMYLPSVKRSHSVKSQCRGTVLDFETLLKRIHGV